MAKDLCRLTLTGRLTRDSELKHTPGGTAVLSIRLAYSTSKKTDEGWKDKSNFIDVTVFGKQAEAVAQYLTKGKQIAVDGRLEWREWNAQDGTKRQAHECIADSITLLGSRNDSDSGGQSSFSDGDAGSFVPAGADNGDFQGSDDDIPF